MVSNIYTNLPISDIVRLLHPRSGDSQGQKTFLAPSADKQTQNYIYSQYFVLVILIIFGLGVSRHFALKNLSFKFNQIYEFSNKTKINIKTRKFHQFLRINLFGKKFSDTPKVYIIDVHFC